MPLPLADSLLLFLILRFRLLFERLAQLVCNLSQRLRGKAYTFILCGLVLSDGIVNLREKYFHLLHQLGAVLLNRLAPNEGVLVGLRLNLRAVYVLDVQTHKALDREKQYQLGEDIVYLILHTVAETVDGDEVRLLIACQPDEVDVTLQRLLYLATGIDVVHVGIDDYLQKHLWVVGTAAALPVQLAE